MDDDPEVIRHQMQETRSSLTDKIERLEQTVTEKVESTTSAVTDTVESVKDAVQDTVDTVRGTVTDTVDSVRDTVHNTVASVKDVFDVRGYFRDYPWASFGAAVGAGFVGGVALGTGSHARGDRISTLHSQGQVATSAPVSKHAHNGGPKKRSMAASFTARPAHAAPGWAGDMSAKFGDEIGKLKGVALGAVFGLVRDWIGRSAPGDVGERISEVIDDVTRKLGGEPIRGNLLDTLGGFTRGKASRERDTRTEARSGERLAADREF